jgi:hypothetical protein
MDVRAGEPRELGQPEPGLKRHDEQGVVPPPGPGGLVGSGKERLGLASVEEGHGPRVGALLGDGKHLGDERGVLGMPEGGKAVEGTQGGQTGVAGAGAVVALVLEVVQEAGDKGRVQIGEVELCRLLAGAGAA